MATKVPVRPEAVEKRLARWVLQTISCRVYAVRESFANHRFLPNALGESANAEIAKRYNCAFSYDTILGDIVANVVGDDASRQLERLSELAVEVGWSDATRHAFVYDSDALLDKEFKAKYNFATEQVDYARLATLRVRAEIFTNDDLAAKRYGKLNSNVYLESQLLNRRTVDACPADFFVGDAPGYFTTSLTWANRVTVATPAENVYAYIGEMVLTGYAPVHNGECALGVVGGIPLRAAFSRQPASQND